jgi:hypothetical protein
MTWEYRIVPQAGSFVDEALFAWREFLAQIPVRRRPNGHYQIFGSVEERDEFEREVARNGDHSDYVDYLVIDRKAVVFDMTRKAVDRARLSRFLLSFLSRWPCSIVGTSGETLGVEEFCNQVTLPPPPS